MTKVPANRTMGLGERKRDTISWALVAINKISGSPLLDRFKVREPTEKLFFEATRSGFKTIGAASRSFKAVKQMGQPARVQSAKPSGLFDLTPTDDQRMLVDAVSEFAAEQLRPAAYEADATCAPPEGLLGQAAELGLGQLAVPEGAPGGLAAERSTVSGVLVAEALAHGDMGLALACLAPAAVTTALGLWGDAA
jgi:alkylation response protein AidB-like acyl-CoA dehydrogenase